MAAAGGPARGLTEESTCPICLEYFAEPVMIVHCGHNFCQACLAGISGTRPTCPQCREPFKPRDLKPNRHLRNMVEHVRRLEKGRKGQRYCKEHPEEPLTLFCMDDRAHVCVVCDASEEHREHYVLPAGKAVKAYKETIQAQLKSLKKESEKLVDRKQVEELEGYEYLKRLKVEKQKIRSTFEQMHKFLEEKEHLLLAHLGDLEKEMSKRDEENASLSGEIFRLTNLITELEEKCQQTESEFLQDIASTLSRFEEKRVGCAVKLSSKVEEGFKICSLKHSLLEMAMEKCQESLEKSLDKETLEQALNKVNVTLDPDTAHPQLILEKDLNSARRGDSTCDLPENPARFDIRMCVLGRERFTSGRHWWEVEVEPGMKRVTWAVGVAKESVARKGYINLNPSTGIWAVGKEGLSSHFGLSAFTSPNSCPLTLRPEPRKFRVSLDYEAGHVEFVDAETDHVIFIFSSASFSGEVIRPFFWVPVKVKMNF